MMLPLFFTKKFWPLIGDRVKEVLTVLNGELIPPVGMTQIHNHGVNHEDQEPNETEGSPANKFVQRFVYANR